jgi:putative ABC transport system ATP-binding protein
MSLAPDSPAIARLPGAALRLRDLRVTYPLPDGGTLEVLDIPALDIAAGEHVAIDGPSGSGKTTLVHVLAGIERPMGGSVTWDGNEIFALDETARDRWRRRTIGLVFQQFHLFPGLSPLENVLLPARFDGFALPAALRRRAHDLLDQVGVRASGEIARFSRGEMQRVAVARALLFAPPLLIADEPTASLDAKSGAALIDLLLAACNAAPTTLIVVTHDPALSRRLATRYRFAQGQLDGRSAPAEVAAE